MKEDMKMSLFWMLLGFASLLVSSELLFPLNVVGQYGLLGMGVLSFFIALIYLEKVKREKTSNV